jgi:polar amino acid transport system substrate-binding protein
VVVAEREGFEPSGPLSQAAFLAGMWFKPNSPTSPSQFILVNGGHVRIISPRVCGLDFRLRAAPTAPHGIRAIPSVTLVNCRASAALLEGNQMRKLRLALSALLGVSVLGITSLSSGAVAGAASTGPSLATCKSTIATQEYAKGKLTVATDNPVYTPWFVNNKPSNAKGYESAVVYAIASILGVAKSNVNWVTEPFDASYAPGPKKFDFDVNEISYTPARARVVTFSRSYYDVQQSIVALKTNKIVKNHSPAQLKNYQYGDQIGTTGLAFINQQIKPTKPARIYSTLDEAVAALQNGQIDALVIDTPSGQYMATSQIVSKAKKLIATQVGQFPSVGEHYGLLLQKHDKLVGCINRAIATLKINGTLTSLANKWLGIYTSVPVIKP